MHMNLYTLHNNNVNLSLSTMMRERNQRREGIISLRGARIENEMNASKASANGVQKEGHTVLMINLLRYLFFILP